MAWYPPRTSEAVAGDRPRPKGLVQQHLPLALTAAAFTVVFFRVLAVARYNPVTFRAILANAGPAQVVLGTLVSVLPVVLALTAAISIPVLYPRGWSVLAHRRHLVAERQASMSRMSGVLVMSLVLAGAVLLGLLLLPWQLFVAALGLCLFEALHIDRTVRRLGHARMRRGLNSWVAGMVVVAVLVGFSATNPAPWLPAEMIELSGKNPLVGYVLDQSDSELVVLRDNDRQVIRVDIGDVESREICQGSSRARLLKIGADYERCPE